jgi:hypothetical protein
MAAGPSGPWVRIRAESDGEVEDRRVMDTEWSVGDWQRVGNTIARQRWVRYRYEHRIMVHHYGPTGRKHKGRETYSESDWLPDGVEFQSAL